MVNKAALTDKTKIKRHSNQSGVAAVEFAIVIIPLLLIVAGIIEFGRTFWYYDTLVKSTRDAARLLSNSRESKDVPLGIDQENQAIRMVINAAEAANIADISSLVVDVNCDTSCNVNNPTYVTVTASYPITIGGWIPFLTPTGIASWTGTLTPHTTMRYMR